MWRYQRVCVYEKTLFAICEFILFHYRAVWNSQARYLSPSRSTSHFRTSEMFFVFFRSLLSSFRHRTKRYSKVDLREPTETHSSPFNRIRKGNIRRPLEWKKVRSYTPQQGSNCAIIELNPNQRRATQCFSQTGKFQLTHLRHRGTMTMRQITTRL